MPPERINPFPFRDFIAYEPHPRLVAETESTRLFFINRESRGDTFLLRSIDPSKRDLMVTQKYLYLPEALPLPPDFDVEGFERFTRSRSIFDERKDN